MLAFSYPFPIPLRLNRSVTCHEPMHPLAIGPGGAIPVQLQIKLGRRSGRFGRLRRRHRHQRADNPRDPQATRHDGNSGRS
jgi:hypothetical protein